MDIYYKSQSIICVTLGNRFVQADEAVIIFSQRAMPARGRAPNVQTWKAVRYGLDETAYPWRTARSVAKHPAKIGE
jgi:hypothetical protein